MVNLSRLGLLGASALRLSAGRLRSLVPVVVSGTGWYVCGWYAVERRAEDWGATQEEVRPLCCTE